MESMNVGTLGGGILDMLVERLTAHGGISFKSAWLRPVYHPSHQRIDVTKGFSEILRDNVIISDRIMSPQDLVTSSRATQKSAWYDIFSSPARSEVVPISGDWWLCILFTVPGNFSYIAFHNIPSENVNFPPNMEGDVRIAPTCRQIISAGIEFLPQSPRNVEEERKKEGEEEEEEEEEENIILLDLTNQVRMMVGPYGDAFGRGWIDVRLVVANAMEESSNLTSFSARILDVTLMGGYISSLIVRTADGGEILSDNLRWSCPDD